MAENRDNRSTQNDHDQEPENAPKTPGKGPNNDNNMRFSRSMLSWILIIVFVVVAFVLVHGNNNRMSEVSATDFQAQVDNGKIDNIDVKDDGTLVGHVIPNQPGSVDGATHIYTHWPLQAIDGLGWRAMLDSAKAKGVAVNYKQTSGLFLSIVVNILPYLLIFVVIWFFFLRQIKSAGGGIGMLGNFGRSRHRLLSKEHTNVTFNDVAGIEEAKEELSEIVEFLKNPKRFQRLGGRIPRGVLLVGEPGVGKTLLAKAIAGEADAPFFSISGSDFVEMFVGVGASRVRDLFKTAKESSPCIIFLDEIDAVGRRRGNGMASGGHDEREQTLNAILVEMDGFDTNDQVIVIASTNRADVLDPALTRPGRFDRQVHVPLPDIKGRYEILKVHAKKVKLSSSVDLLRLARQTPMFSGADLAAIINEAALMATMLNKDAIEMVDLEESRDKLRFGKARKSRVIDEKEKEIIAWHEAGHAIINALETDYDPLHKVTIISRRGYGGASFSIPEKDRIVHSRRYMEANLRVAYGGRLAEEMFIGDISSGASSDINGASHMARAMVCDYGMSALLGPIKFSPDENRQSYFEQPREYSDKTAELIDSEVHALIEQAYNQAKQILLDHKDAVVALKDALMKYETVDGDDVKRILAGQTISKPTVADLLASEQQRRSADARREAEKRDREAGPDMGAMPQPG
jgi:cell division protease FtsH